MRHSDCRNDFFADSGIKKGDGHPSPIQISYLFQLSNCFLSNLSKCCESLSIIYSHLSNPVQEAEGRERKQTRFSSQYLPITCTKQQGPVCSCTFFRKIFLCCNNVYYSGTAMGKSSRNCRFYCIFVRLVSSFFASFNDNNFIFSEGIFILRQRFTPTLNLTQFIFFAFYDWKIWNRFIKIQEWNHDFSPY